MLTDIADLYAANPALFAGSVFVLGLMVGSFLNVVIYRLPIMLEREWRARRRNCTSVDRDHRGRPRRRRPRRPAEPLQPGDTPLRLPRLQDPHQRLCTTSRCSAGSRCAAAAPPAKRRISRALPGGRARHRHPLGLGRLAFRLRRRRLPAPWPVTWALIALTGIDIDHQLLPDSITLPLLWAGCWRRSRSVPCRARRCRCRRKMRSSGRPPDT